MAKRLYLIRHCEAEGQSREAKLTPKGVEQAQRLRDFFSTLEIDRIVSSPFVRARQSIEPTSQKHHVAIEIEERLSERILSTSNLPDWLVKLEETFKDREVTYDGGESSRGAAGRIKRVVDELLSRPDKTIIMVTHGNLMSLLLNHFNPDFGFEQWKRLTNPDVYLLEFSNQHPIVKRLWTLN